MNVRDFLVSLPGLFLVLIFRMLISSLFLCAGIQLFRAQNLFPFLTWKRWASLFLLILGMRLLVSSVFFFPIP